MLLALQLPDASHLLDNWLRAFLDDGRRKDQMSSNTRDASVESDVYDCFVKIESRISVCKPYFSLTLDMFHRNGYIDCITNTFSCRLSMVNLFSVSWFCTDESIIALPCIVSLF